MVGRVKFYQASTSELYALAQERRQRCYLARLLLEKGYVVRGIKRRSSSFNTDRIDDLYVDPETTPFYSGSPYVAAEGVEIVARAVEIGRHGGDKVVSELPPIGLTSLSPAI